MRFPPPINIIHQEMLGLLPRLSRASAGNINDLDCHLSILHSADASKLAPASDGYPHKGTRFGRQIPMNGLVQEAQFNIR